jgi:secretion/DNA translocation related TadE-like protein
MRTGGRPVRSVAGRVSHGGDRGAASVWLLALGVAVVAMAAFGASVGAAIVARHQAQTAADLGALSAAVHAVEGSTAACGHATRVVSANHAQMVQCRVVGLEAVVSVRRRAAGLAAALPHALARSRAGPVSADWSGGLTG